MQKNITVASSVQKKNKLNNKKISLQIKIIIVYCILLAIVYGYVC